MCGMGSVFMLKVLDLLGQEMDPGDIFFYSSNNGFSIGVMVGLRTIHRLDGDQNDVCFRLLDPTPLHFPKLNVPENVNIKYINLYVDCSTFSKKSFKLVNFEYYINNTIIQSAILLVEELRSKDLIK